MTKAYEKLIIRLSKISSEMEKVQKIGFRKDVPIELYNEIHYINVRLLSLVLQLKKDPTKKIIVDELKEFN
jgi:hypothetical protein